MQYRPLRSLKAEITSSHIKKVVIVLCILVITGFVLTVSYYKQFSTSISFYQYRLRGLKNIKNSQFFNNVSVESVTVYQKPNHTLNVLNGTKDNVAEGYNVNDTYTSREEDDAQLSWNDTRLDILHMPKLQFNRRFKNPCWYEPLTSPRPYENNTVILYSSSAKKTLKKLTARWESLFEKEEQPSRLRCLPYFMIIGQPKCGSTDLYWKIVQHPDIDHPPIKELHWWTRSRQGRRFSYRKIVPFRDYVDMFDNPALKIHTRWNNITELEQNEDDSNEQQQIVTGEASVSLFWDNDDWKKYPENWNHPEPLYVIPHYIHHIIPHVKLVLMFREPADRMYSDYLYFHSDNKSADDFHNSVVHAIGLYENCIKQKSQRACVYSKSLSYKVRVRLRVGMYSVYLKDWLSVFPKSQFLILRLEDYSEDQTSYLRQIYSFLGQRQLSEEEEALFEDQKSNVRKQSDRRLGSMYDETREILQNFYRPFNIDLSAMLQDPRFLWEDS